MSQFLIELFSEEIPAAMQQAAKQHLLKFFKTQAAAAGLTFENAAAFVTPQRLVLHATGLPSLLPEREEELKGPRIDAPDQAIAGFLKKVGISLDACEKRDMGKKGTFLFAVKKIPGQPTPTILKTIIENLLGTFPWPKSMRWGNASFKWVRPLHHILPLFDDEVIPITPPHPYVDVGRTTKGHRFMAPETFDVLTIEDYFQYLDAHHVVLDDARRKSLIEAGLKEAANKKNLTVANDPGLLNEVTGLVEFPHILMGNIAKTYMKLPAELLQTCMRVHQRYFTVRDKNGKIAPHFLFVSNIVPKESAHSVIEGNERVLGARLADADYFWTLDLKSNFEIWNNALKDQIFHADLGTVYDRIERFQKLMNYLTPGNAMALDAAKYCKADLMSQMVFEFPELQGIMGGYYAQAFGFSEEIGQALKEQYLPAGPSDAAPKTSLGAHLSLIDKVDMICGFFKAGIIPTGSKDPFALRRAAISIIRIIEAHELNINLTKLLEMSLTTYGVEPKNLHPIIQKITQFILDRLNVHLRDAHHHHSVVQATIQTLQHQNVDLLEIINAVRLLDAFRASEAGASSTTALRRVENILEKSDGVDRELGQVNPQLLSLEAEKELWHALQNMPKTKSLKAFLEGLSPLTNAIHDFFESTLINDPDDAIRTNRLCLLQKVATFVNEKAPLAQIEEKEG